MGEAIDGIRVLELGQVIAGPFCAQLLGDLGADVIKIEPPGVGDVLRQWGHRPGGGDSLWWRVTGRNKRSVTIDVRKPEGQDLVRRLAGKADILVENFRPGTMERWGLGWAELSAVNPRLIMVRISGFGQDGPYAARAGYAAIGEAMGGLRALTGYPDRPPVRVGVSIGDSLTGMFGALGALAALAARGRTGRGQVVDASIFESVLAVTEALVTDWHAEGLARERTGPALPGIAPSNVYPTGDGQVLIAANQDSVFARLAAVMGTTRLSVNSFHHQAVDRLGTGLCACAWAPDGAIEAIEDPERPFVVAVQWHAETLQRVPGHLALFEELVNVATRSTQLREAA